MAAERSLLDTYYKKQTELEEQMTSKEYPKEILLQMQELRYRISVLETFKMFCMSVPESCDPKVLDYHYQMMAFFVQMLLKERKFGLLADERGEKARSTAEDSLTAITRDSMKRIAIFDVQNQYKANVLNRISAILPAWIQYRNTYVKV